MIASSQTFLHSVISYDTLPPLQSLWSPAGEVSPPSILLDEFFCVSSLAFSAEDCSKFLI